MSYEIAADGFTEAMRMIADGVDKLKSLDIDPDIAVGIAAKVWEQCSFLRKLAETDERINK